jgi:mannosylglycerate hydrolase
VRKSRTTQTMTVVVRMRVPASIESDRATSAREFVENTGEMTLTLCAGSPAVSCTLQWRNRSKDQRTRLLLRWLPNAASVTLSDSAFSLDRRAVRTADYPKEITRSEMPVAVHPSHSIVIGGGWWLAHHAMQEHEVVDVHGERSLAMTLVRSVGWLSRRDLVTRGVGAGPDFETPDAQCLRAEAFEFAFGLAVSDEGAVEQAFHAARLLRRPLLVLRGYATSARPSVDIGNDILQISNTRIVADHIEIRLWNPTGEPQSIAIDTNVWRRVRADGTPLEAPVDMVAPYAIHTLRAPLPARASAIE